MRVRRNGQLLLVASTPAVYLSYRRHPPIVLFFTGLAARDIEMLFQVKTRPPLKSAAPVLVSQASAKVTLNSGGDASDVND